ncbi:MAG: PKD domain-containing protein [Bacteroidota bacterium]
MIKRLAYVLIPFLFAANSSATHIVGGEIYYDYLGNNDYLVTLKVYRDCINGQAPFDNPATVGVYNAAGTLVTTLSMAFPGATQLPITLNNPCFVPPSNVCVEEAVYTDVVNLPPIAGGYYLSYQRCCRNQTILNIINPLAVGSTYVCHIPDPSLAVGNSSPRYDSLPPLFMCANVPFTFNHSATDPDGDSLVYELCDPYDGGSQTNPMPVPPAAPPYAFVPWQVPYNATYPMSANPAMSININTGLLTGTPNMIGQWVVAVCVKEYRGGQLLSVNKRDYQFNVLNCPGIVVSSIPSQVTFCFGYTVNFLNSSVNATTYWWNFGDHLSNGDTSLLPTPTYTYSDSGVYNVMLIANPGLPCADTGYTTFYIYPLLAPSFIPPPGQCITGNSFSFTAGGNFMGNGTFAWNFGPNATPQTSSAQNPTNVTFSAPGVYPITLTVSENGCTQTYTDSVIVHPLPTASFNSTPQAGCAPFMVQFTNSSLTGNMVTNYLWDFGDGSFSVAPNPIHTYTQPGVYTVTLTVVTTNGCVDTLTFVSPNMITVHPKPTAFYTADPLVTSIFYPEVTFTDLSQGNTACMLYYGDGNWGNCSGTYSYQAPGVYDSYQVVLNEFGCSDTFSLRIEIRPEFRFFIPNAFTPNADGHNEIFMPKVMGVTNYKFMIFDRWGQLFFITDDPKAGWDGTFKGDPCQQDVYVWKIVCTDVVEWQEHTYIGHVTLVR